MKYSGMNFENVKNNNRSAILHVLNSEGPLSRKDIAKKTGLTAASVTQICTEFMEEGVLVELGEAVEEKRAGRKKILVDICGTYKYLLCISIESDVTYISVTDCKGNILENREIPTDKEEKEEAFLEKVASVSTELLWKQNIAKKDILGAAVSVPGIVDREKGVSLNTISIWKHPVAVAEILENKLEIPVVVENNLKTSAESEILFGKGKTDGNLILVKWGPGVGSSMIIDRKIYHGENDMAAELGHVTLGKNGKVCNCGRKGCLETEISTHAFIEDIQRIYQEGKTEDMPQLTAWLKDNTMTYRNASQWMALKDTAIQDLIEDKLDKLAFCLRNYMALFDAKYIILTGYIFEQEGMVDRFIQAYRGYDEQISEELFQISDFPERVHHIEPLAVALNEWFY